jgi:hypothetical protein
LEEKMVSKVSDEFAGLNVNTLGLDSNDAWCIGSAKMERKAELQRSQTLHAHGYYLGKQFDLFKKIKGKLYFLF